MLEKKLSKSKLLLFPSTYVMWILYPSPRENKKSKPIQLYSRRQS